MKIISPAFSHGGRIPAKYTCDGENISPPLAIVDIPEAATSLALVMDDPDAPGSTFVHWVVGNIPRSVAAIAEDTAPGIVGTNSYRKAAYGGPCPPSGTHRYFFKLYGLDHDVDFHAGMTKADLEAAMQGHIVEQTELIGLYQRGKI